MTQVVADEKLGKIARQQNDLFRRVREGALDPDWISQEIQRLIEGCALVVHSVYEATPSERRAREIMGKNYLGVEEASEKYGVNFTKKQLQDLAYIPFTEATLEEYKTTHILVVGFPLSIMDIRGKAPRSHKTFYTYDDVWYNGEKFAKKEKVGVRWYLIRKDIISGSTSKTFSEQQAMLSEKEEIPRACEFAYAVVLYHLVTGERLFPNIYARCIDLVSGDYRVFSGGFGAGGLVVDSYWDGSRSGNFGVASARKFN